MNILSHIHRLVIFVVLSLISFSCFSADKLSGKIVAGWVGHVFAEGKATLDRKFLRGATIIDPDETFLAQSIYPKVK